MTRHTQNTKWSNWNCVSYFMSKSGLWMLQNILYKGLYHQNRLIRWKVEVLQGTTSTLVQVGLIKEIQWYHDVPQVTTSYFIKCSCSMAWSFSCFISAAQEWTKFTHFVSQSQANIIFSSDLPKLPFCKFEWSHNPLKNKKCSQTCQTFCTYPLTQCVSLHNYEAHPGFGYNP